VTDPSVGRAIGRLGGAFMFSRYTKAVSDAAAFDDSQASYLAGRVGVLGPVDVEVAGAVLTFFALDRLRTSWTLACETTDVRAYAGRWIEAGHEWGRARLAGLEGVDRLADLALAVVREADVAAAPLFAAWRTHPLPPDAEARAFHAVFLLREHRGAMHQAAVLTSPLTPLQAVLSGPGGQDNAVTFGWTEPFEDPAPLAGLRAEVERTTDQAAARPYAVLDDREQAELAQLLEMAVARAFPRATLDGR
jgi:hypothetical protein